MAQVSYVEVGGGRELAVLIYDLEVNMRKQGDTGKRKSQEHFPGFSLEQ